jgi:nickel-dependent lactate racemase
MKLHTDFLELPYINDRKIPFRVSAGTVAAVYEPRAIQTVDHPETLVDRALDNPIESSRLEARVKPSDQVIVICDDVTRPTPANLLIPPVLDRLNRAGLPDSNIQVLFALGTHRPMNEAEMRAKVGNEVFQRVACHNHDAFNKAELHYFGKSEDGVDVWLNRRVKEATFVIGIGDVSPHAIVGYSGGAKILYPGVAGADTVLGFHIALSLDPTNYYGVYPSPGRARIRNLADVVGLDFVVNSVLCNDDQIYKVYAGSHNAVLEKGVRAARTIYGVSSNRLYDVVVTSSYPHSIDFWQGVKGAYAAASLAKPEGEIILATACPEGGAKSYPDYASYVGMSTEDLARQLTERACTECLCVAGALKAAQMREKYRISLISDGLSQGEIKQMGFESYVTIEDALAAAFSRTGWQDEIGVIPYGGHTYCYIG